MRNRFIKEPNAAEWDSSIDADNTAWLQKVDAFLANMSWDKTWAQMSELINSAIATRQQENARLKSKVETRSQRAAGVA